ncbi:MAG: Rab family GTPase [Thermoplasmata archaeon]
MLRTRRDASTKVKVCAVGEEAVGKTSLIRRYVADTFEEEYTRSIGTLLSKKTIKVEDAEGHPVKVDAVIWDIMGRRSFTDLLKGAYFQRARGVFAVCDITRRQTLGALHGWLVKFRSAVGLAPAVIMVNKSDLHGKARISEKDVMKIGKTYGAPHFLTSAKTGRNVSEAFESLMREILRPGKQKVSGPRGE